MVPRHALAPLAHSNNAPSVTGAHKLKPFAILDQRLAAQLSWLLICLSSLACTSETILETDDITASSAQPICRSSNASVVMEDVENVCSCLVIEVSTLLETSCGNGMTAETLGRVTQAMFEDCSLNLSACEATLDDLEVCSVAANSEFADACRVGFPEQCRGLALTRGCAFYVGCPDGYVVETNTGVSSCVEEDT